MEQIILTNEQFTQLATQSEKFILSFNNVYQLGALLIVVIAILYYLTIRANKSQLNKIPILNGKGEQMMQSVNQNTKDIRAIKEMLEKKK